MDINVYTAKLKLAELEARAGKSAHKNDALLRAALEACIEAPKRLPAEIENIDKAIQKIKEEGVLDDTAVKRIKRLNFDKKLITFQVFRAAKESKRSEERRVGKECRSRWSP